MTAPVSNPRRSRLTILAIALICIVPFAAAWYLAKHPELVADQKRGNYGHLIDPARPLDYADFFQSPITSAEHLDEVKGHWVMLQVSSGPVCNEACVATAQKTGQLRLMLNKEITRVRRVLLVPGQPDAASMRALTEADPTLLIVGVSDALRQRLQEAAGRPLEDGMVLLMDPFANLMMWYPAGFDPYGALRDLQRLLRISQIG